jgi:O-antigen biosynthesis protein WbqP
MNRLINILLAAVLFVMFLPLMLCIAVAIKLTSRGPVLHLSKRVGQGNVHFRMPKFRTMYSQTPQLATHLLTDPERWITPVGAFLRKTSLDELPQLWSVLIGQMNFVGPRPALFNQDDLVELRSLRGIDQLLPGLTGWAQINGRDNISIPDKVALEEYYLEHRCLRLDVLILVHTIVKVLRREDVADGGGQALSTRRVA